MSDPLLQVIGLHKSFGALLATNDLSFQVQTGELHALIGPNGAGKTTLVNQLSGDLRPDDGKILFGGRDITTLKAHRRARLGIARSFQITQIFEGMTVAENLGLALLAGTGGNFHFFRHWRTSSRINTELTAALTRFDLLHHADQPAGSLSHGEKRQLEVGMALVVRPRLLILDEPMAGLGPGGTVELTKIIRQLKGELTILLVEHDMDVVFSLADHITVLVYGHQIASGSPEEIRTNPEVRKAYLGEEV
jgi:branched-chain amino acid transport system ATP-binding protein